MQTEQDWCIPLLSLTCVTLWSMTPPTQVHGSLLDREWATKSAGERSHKKASWVKVAVKILEASGSSERWLLGTETKLLITGRKQRQESEQEPGKCPVVPREGKELLQVDAFANGLQIKKNGCSYSLPCMHTMNLEVPPTICEANFPNPWIRLVLSRYPCQ